MNGLLFIKKKSENVLDYEPYATFIKKYDKLGENILNRKIKWKISSNNKSTEGDGLEIQSLYCERFDLEFEYYMTIDEDLQNQRFSIIHTISYKFDDSEDLRDIMYYTINDIQKKNGRMYISNLVKECDINTSVDGKANVHITFAVQCNKNDAKEVCLQLLSQDMALFARSF